MYSINTKAAKNNDTTAGIIVCENYILGKNILSPYSSTYP